MLHSKRNVWTGLVSVLFVLVGMVVSVSPAFAGTNLVPNGDLETAAAGSATTPAGWATDSWGTLTPVFTYPVTGNGGGKGAQVQITKYSSGDAKWYFNHVAVTPGTTYQISDDYNSNVASNITIEYKSSSGAFSYAWVADLPSTGGVWKTASSSIKVPTGVVAMTVLHVIQSVGTLTLDNMYVGIGAATPPPPPAPKPAISSFSANPVSIAQGSTTLLSWSVVNASSTSIDQGVGAVVGTSLQVSPSQTTKYTLTATNPNGSVVASTTVTVVVPLPPPPPPPAKPVINSFAANPQTITKGQSSTLSWSVTGSSTTLSIDQGVGTVTGTSKSVSPTATTTYTLTASNAGGTTTATAVVNVIIPAIVPPPPVPTCSLGATPQQIANGSSTLLSWTSQNAKTASLDNAIGSVATSSTRSVSPTATTTYTLTVFNGGTGTSTCSTVVGVTQAILPPPPPANNLINNGDFESGAANAPTGWNADFWGSMKATFTYPVTGNGGGKAAKIVVTNYTSGDAKWWFNHVPVSSHTIYQFSDDYISNVIDNVSIEFLLSDGSYDYEWLANTPPTGGAWSHFTAQVTVPPTAVSMTVLHTLVGNGNLTIDNASLTALPANPFATGMVTFTFDDGLASQFANGRSIINAAGMKAGFYIITQGVQDVSGDSAYMSWANIKTLKNDGHEIGGHTRTHPDLTLISPSAAQTEIQGSYSDLAAQGLTPKAFVYPLGGVSPAIETMVKNAGYSVARGSYSGMNSPTVDKFSLYDIRLDQTTTLAQAQKWVDQAVADKRWVIFELHDILSSGGDEYSITPALLQSIVNYVKQSGAKVVTLQGGLQYLTP